MAKWTVPTRYMAARISADSFSCGTFQSLLIVRLLLHSDVHIDSLLLNALCIYIYYITHEESLTIRKLRACFGSRSSISLADADVVGSFSGYTVIVFDDG